MKPTIWCQVNRLAHPPHRAERNSAGDVYLYLDHPGAAKFSCLQHAGICHEACWTSLDDGTPVPALRARTVKS